MPPLITDVFPTFHFDLPWQLLRPAAILDPEASIRFDEKLLQQVGRGELGPCLCIKQDPQCLVATRRESRMENFDSAAKILATDGWPIVVRASGGGCVPQGPGVLNLSLVYPRLKNWTLTQGYLVLCELLGRLLRSYGLEATIGEVPGSFCDGCYNLQVGGKKLVGMAQRWAGGNRAQAAILAHACLLVDLDLVEATGQINRLYRLCNNPQQFKSEATTCLRACLDPARQRNSLDFRAEVEERLCALLTRTFVAA